MNQRVEKIRRLLRELEAELATGPRTESPAHSSSDLALVVQQIVDDLQPLLTPYDAAFYWFLAWVQFDSTTRALIKRMREVFGSAGA